MRWLRRKRFWLFVAVVVGIALITVFFPKGWFVIFRNWVRTLGVWAIPMYIGVYVGVTLFALPNALLMLGAGTLFGFTKGLLYVSIADTLGALACFVVGKTIARERIKRWISRRPNWQDFDQAIARKGWKIVLLTRLSPILPSSVLNYGFSCTKVKFTDYLLFSWLGMLPVIAFYVYLGAFGSALFRQHQGPQWMILQGLGLAATIATAFYTTRLAKRALTQTEGAEKA